MSQKDQDMNTTSNAIDPNMDTGMDNEIVSSLKVSVSKVKARGRERTYTDDDITKVFDLYYRSNLDYSRRQISDMLGLSVSTVTNICNNIETAFNTNRQVLVRFCKYKNFTDTKSVDLVRLLMANYRELLKELHEAHTSNASKVVNKK